MADPPCLLATSPGVDLASTDSQRPCVASRKHLSLQGLRVCGLVDSFVVGLERQRIPASQFVWTALLRSAKQLPHVCLFSGKL